MSIDESLDRLTENIIKVMYRFTISETPCIFAMLMISISCIMHVMFPNLPLKYELFITGLAIFTLKSILTRFMYLWCAIKQYEYQTMHMMCLLICIILPPKTHLIAHFILTFVLLLYFSAWIDNYTYEIRCQYNPHLRTQTKDTYHRQINEYGKNIYLTDSYVSLSLIVILANANAEIMFDRLSLA